MYTDYFHFCFMASLFLLISSMFRCCFVVLILDVLRWSKQQPGGGGLSLIWAI